MTRREQIARIVDAEAFRPGVPAEIRPGMAGSIVADIERRDRALAKADQIMGVEGEADRRNVRVIPDADNANELRVFVGAAQWCKVYGFSPDEAKERADTIVQALKGPTHD